MRSDELRKELDKVERELKPLIERRQRIQNALDDALSREWIAACKVTKDKVMTVKEAEESRGSRWFGDVWTFGKWLKENQCDKPWAEWNGRIYNSEELKAGKLSIEAPGMVEHLEA